MTQQPKETCQRTCRGPKATLALAEMLLSVTCVAGSFVQYHELQPWWLQVVMSMFARFAAGICLKCGFLIINELFPTPIRNSAAAIGGAFGGIGSILGLLLEPLEIYWKPLPAIIIGLNGILSALMVIFLPETKGKTLPESYEDVHDIIQK